MIGTKNILGLSCITANLRQKQVNAEWRILIVEVSLQFIELLPEHLWCVSDTTDDTETTGVCDGGSQLGAGGHVHTSQEDWVVDLEKISDGSAENLYS